MANELLIGARLDSDTHVIIPTGSGEVIVTGTGASLTLFGSDLPANQVSLDVVQGSLVVENGGKLVTFGSGVGRVAGATGGLVSVTGRGSSWVENDTLSIGTLSPGQVVIADGASFQGAQNVIVGTLGKINIGVGGLAGIFSAPGITNNGIIDFNFTDSITFGVPISGSGQIVKDGTGALTLTGASPNFAGTVTVNSGSLIVNGQIACALTQVNPGGLLSGDGTLDVPEPPSTVPIRIVSAPTPPGSLINNGIVSPGDPVGKLTVSGNYIQNANGTLRIEVAGSAPGKFGLLAVGGNASLAGTLQFISLGPFKLQVGETITFLTAKSVTGTFSTIQNPFISNTIVKADVVYLPDGVQLVGEQGSFTEAACNPNSLAVAKALDSAVGDPRAARLIGFLDNQPISQLCSDFTLIAPDQLTSIYNIAVSLANVQTANLERRMDDVRRGSTGFSSAGFTMNGITPSFTTGLGGPTGAEGKAGPPVLAPVPENRWGVFVTGLGEFTHVDSTDIARGFDLQTGGFTLGVDYRIGSNFVIGLIGGYAHTNSDLANNGNLDVNSGNFGLYATAFSGGFYLDTALTGGFDEYDSRRAAILGAASGNTDGGELNVLVNGGYDWKQGGLRIGPTASFQYTYVSFNGFTETGSLAPLKFNDQHVDSIRTAFGGKASYDWKVGRIRMRPELRAAWQHEYGSSAYSIVSSFANGAGSSFTVTSPRIGRDSLLLSAGVTVLLSDRVSTYVYYDGELGRTNYQSNNVSAGFQVTF